MTKKITLGLVALIALTAGVVGLSAFEAHVINVTAKIENALRVDTAPINFGTVFPQEQLDKFFNVTLSDSFLAEPRVDDIEYMIRQKPKCGITTNDGEVLVGPTATGHVSLGPVDEVIIDCGPAPRQLATNESWGVLPLLCPYLSKHEVTQDRPESDVDVPAFHQPWTFSGHQIVWTQALGRLSKAAGDTLDTWKLDLKVPCFGGNCAQDWAAFVTGINASATPAEYVQDIKNEHKVFGCDLWIEVFGISLPGFGCNEELDMMLVLDRSGSIDDTELATLQSAASAFVEALMPAATGNDVHVGQSSFSSSGTLDQHLTDVKADVLAAIAGLVNAGATDLEAGITLATGEMASHVHERDAVKDVMVIITDGNPNVPDVDTGKTDAAAAADVARAAGIEVFVVGVGDSLDATYLTDEIADAAPPTHYFFAVDFDDLEAVLESLTECPA